ncbi:hypothetical protein KKD49_13245 [Myxococcota bacterium]|nr:hypothetical protein [Myxococcota bacterium]
MFFMKNLQTLPAIGGTADRKYAVVKTSLPCFWFRAMGAIQITIKMTIGFKSHPADLMKGNVLLKI